MVTKLFRSTGARVLGIASVAALIASVNAAPSALDPLIQAAPRSIHGDKAMLLAVTRAGNRLVAVGERGLVLTSEDNGAGWKQAAVPVSVLLTGVRFASADAGWVVGHGGVVLRTDDGGHTWRKSLDGGQAAALLLKSVRNDAGSGDDAVRRLAEAERLAKDGADKPFFDILTDGENKALVIGAYGLAYRTEDGGKSWVPWQAHIANPKGAHLHAISAADDAVYIAGEQGLFLASRDKGHSFAAVKTPYTGSYFGVAAISAQKLLLFGLRGKSYWSSDGGATWQPCSTGIEASFNGATVLGDGSVLMVSQAGHVLRSTDEGRSFQPVPALPTPFVGVAQAADGGIVLVGARGAMRLPKPAASKS